MKRVVIVNDTPLNPNNAVYYFVAGLLLLPVYIRLMNVLSIIFGFSTTYTTYAAYGLLWLALLLTVRMYFKDVAKYAIFVCIGVILITIFSVTVRENSLRYIWNPSVLSILTFSSNFLSFSMLFIVIGMIIKDYAILLNLLTKFSRIGIVFGALIYVLSIANGIHFHYDDMTNAYAISALLCILIVNKQRHDGILIVLGLLSLLLAGTRGPILCIMVAFILKTTLLEKNSRKRIFVAFLYISIAVLLLYTGIFDGFMISFGEILDGMGVENLRIVDYYQEGLLFDDSGRNDIYEMTVNSLKNSPFLGYGVGGDRYVLGSDSYCHNLILEILISYGFILGSIFILLLSVYCILILANQNMTLRTIAVALFCCSVIKLMLSSSYLYSYEFFIFLGLCFANGGKLKVNVKLK